MAKVQSPDKKGLWVTRCIVTLDTLQPAGCSAEDAFLLPGSQGDHFAAQRTIAWTQLFDEFVMGEAIVSSVNEYPFSIVITPRRGNLTRYPKTQV